MKFNKLLKAWYTYTTTYYKFWLESKIGILIGIIFGLFLAYNTKFTFKGILWGIIGGVVIGGLFTLYSYLLYKIVQRGEKITNLQPSSFSDVDKNESKNLICYQLATLINKGYSKEEIIKESQKYKISKSKMLSTIWFNKYPLAGILIIALVTIFIVAIILYMASKR